MGTAGKIAVVGGVAGLALLVYAYVSRISNLATNLIVTPKFSGSITWQNGGIVIPLDVDFGNRSDASITVQLNALDVHYNKSVLAQSTPTANAKVVIAPYSTSTLKGIQVQLNTLSLITILGGSIATLITEKNTDALLDYLKKDIDLYINITANNAFTTSINMKLYESKQVESGNNGAAGLGLVAASRRSIGSKNDYIHLIPPKTQLKYEDKIIISDVTVEETVEQMHKEAKLGAPDTALLARELYADDIRQSVKNCYDFVYNYIQYVPDSVLNEQLRTPLRTLFDQQGDCDCYSVLIGSLLENMGIKYRFRIADYGKGWQHVYVVVPTQKYGTLVCDPVVDKCFYEKQPFKYKDL